MRSVSKVEKSGVPTIQLGAPLWTCGPHTWPGIFQLEPSHSSRCAAVGNHTRCSLFAPSCLTFCSSTWKWVNHADRPPATEQRLSAVFLDHEMDPSTSTSRWLSYSLRRLLGCLGLLQLWLISFNLFNIYICTGWHLIKLIIMHVCSRDRDYPL